jgi:hypothetical protein
MRIANLPKDILGLVFSQMWRIDATGVPLTCKLFAFVVKSKRYFKGWKAFTITIQDMPNALRRYEDVGNALSHTQFKVVKYDHYNTMADLLRLIVKENKFYSQNIRAFYGLNEHGIRIALPKHKRVTHALFALSQHCRHIIYCSSLEDLPPVN